MAVIGWLDTEQVLVDWVEANSLSDEALADVLEAAYDACVAFAPALPEGAPVPAGYRIAQLDQARAIWAASGVAAGDQNGTPDFGVPLRFPLDWTVKQLLRPKRGRYDVG